ncbi:MAG: ATP-dependent sacrificial sulfur transferase LarE [Candidatus Heimdallarchaeota archaeon]|nr:ATP-dependent sacrificial sulfur transferase LarE [Candidatus Heimdallarchaeota archaeon]
MNAKEKLIQLEQILHELGQVVIAFSGGIDSTLLAQVAFNVLGNNAIAITIASPLMAPEELEQAKDLAKSIGIKHYILDKSQEIFPWFIDNPPDRCYICKKGTIESILDFCKSKNIQGQLIEGSNFDDLDDYRPGFKAVQEMKVRSPLIDTKLTKDEIRELSKELELNCWDKPASPCLATRFFFGEEINKEKIQMVYTAEKFLKSLGLTQVRVRVHKELARIETLAENFTILLTHSNEITSKFKELGFSFVTMDLNGYKKGSMNKTNNS